MGDSTLFYYCTHPGELYVCLEQDKWNWSACKVVEKGRWLSSRKNIWYIHFIRILGPFYFTNLGHTFVVRCRETMPSVRRKIFPNKTSWWPLIYENYFKVHSDEFVELTNYYSFFYCVGNSSKRKLSAQCQQLISKTFLFRNDSKYFMMSFVKISVNQFIFLFLVPKTFLYSSM